MSRYVEANLYIGKKKIGITALITVAVILFVACAAAVLILIPGRGIATISQGRKLLEKERFIIHAGGFVIDENGTEHVYTNSIEALNNCYDSGNRIAEFDFMMTADDRVVCAHDADEEGKWAYGIEGAGFSADYPAYYEDFMAAKFEGVLTTMSLDDLAAFMKAHSDFYVITDVKDDNVWLCRAIMEKYPELAQSFIVQIYHEDEYDRIRAAGFPYMIYTLYRATDEELETDALMEFVKSHKLLGVTFWDEFPEKFPESFEALKKEHIPTFVHTINDPEQIREYFDMGVTGIYTDVTDKNRQIGEGE